MSYLILDEAGFLRAIKQRIARGELSQAAWKLDSMTRQHAFSLGWRPGRYSRQARTSISNSEEDKY